MTRREQQISTARADTKEWAKQRGFLLKKYDAFKDLDLNGWTQQLQERDWLRRLQNREIGGFKNATKILEQGLKRIFESPLLDVGSMAPQTASKLHGASVRAITLADAHEIGANVQALVSFADRRADGTGSTFDEFYDLLEWDGTKNRPAAIRGHLSIDLAAPEEQILYEATRAILALREQALHLYGPPKAKSPKDRVPPVRKERVITVDNSWHKYRVMAFLDLSLAALVDRKKISNEDWGRLLLGGTDLGETIRKSTEWYAEQLMHPYTLRAMQLQCLLGSIPIRKRKEK